MLEQHIRYLSSRGVSEATWAARGVRSLDAGDATVLLDLGFEAAQVRLPGLLLPSYNPLGQNGRYQYRPDEPRTVKGRVVKFESPKKKRNQKPTLDVHPSNADKLDDPTIDLWVTEGLPKADAATERGLYAVALLGVSAWMTPEWKYIALGGRTVYICFDSDVMEKADVHRAMEGLSGELQKMGAIVRYVYLPDDEGRKVGLDDYFASGKGVDDLYGHASAELREIESDQPRTECDDIGNGQRFAREHKDAARYDPISGKWYIWCGTHWRKDADGLEVDELAKATARGIHREAFDTGDPAHRAALGKWAALSASNAKRAAMIEAARADLRVDRETFDAHDHLLNCLNGTVDLRDGALGPHDPAHLITRVVPTRYVPRAAHETWDRYLDGLGLSDAVRGFLLRSMGYSLYGRNREEVFFFLYGPGGSGKSTFTEAVRRTVGKGEGFGDHVNAGSFTDTKRRGGDTFNDFAGVATSRVLFATEWPAGVPIDAALIKGLTGGDPLQVRFLFREFFSFEPLFTPWFFGNDRPPLPPDDGGMWRRVVFLPFPVKREEMGERDRTIKQTLCDDAGAREAILAALVAGATDYHRRGGLDIPDEIRRATQQYRNVENPAADWLAACCVRAEGATLAKAEAHADFLRFEKTRGIYEGVSANKFSRLLSALGIADGTAEGGTVRVWKGLHLQNGPQVAPKVTHLAENDAFGGFLHSPIEYASRSSSETHYSVTYGPNASPNPPLRLLTDHAEALSAVAELASHGKPLALDIETTGLSPRTDSVRLLQLSDGADILILDAKHLGDLRPFVPDGVELIGHNLAFEFGFLPPNRTHRAWDTMLASQVLNGGTYEKNDLASVAARHAGVTLDKAMQISDWSGDLTEEQIAYAARDVLHLHTIMDDQIAALSNEGLLPTAELEMRTLMAVQWMASSGVALDWPRWEAVARAKAEAQGALLARLKEHAEINWQSNPQVLAYFTARGCAIANTQEETLAALDDDVAQLLVEYRGYQKLTSTYGLNWAAYLHEGRVHADWWQIETRTGRMSCKNPNLQNVPRSADYRSMFTAPDGRVLIKADYSQIELRIAAQIANEPTMLAAYREGRDLHRLTASRVTGKPLAEVTKADRQMAKAVNFGFIYGMGATKFQSYAEGSYGVAMSGADAFNAREAFFSLYPKLRDWHSEQGGKWESPPIDTHTIGGRRRREVRFFAERLNSPVQGTGGDGIKNALALLWEHPLADDIFPVLCVHDEIVVEAPQERAEEAKQWLVGHMVDGMAAYLTAVPVEVEATIARNWAGGE